MLGQDTQKYVTTASSYGRTLRKCEFSIEKLDD